MVKRISIFIFILTSSTSIVLSQPGSAGTYARATVVEPITLTKSVDLNFDQVAIIIAGSIELVPAEVKASASNITLPVTMGTFTAASFNVTGSTAYTFKFTVSPTPYTVPMGNGTMIVRSFDCDPILDSDSELLAGVFVSVTPMDVTVNYN